MIKTTKEICASCNQTVYPTEKMGLEGMVIHKNCFICQHCKRKLTVGNFAAVNGQIFCKAHYLALFKEHGGRYDKAFGAFQSGGSGRNLVTKAEADESASELNQSTAAASVASEAASEGPSVLLDTSVNNKSALDVSAISQASEDSTVNSVKARKEALERKSSLGSTTTAATAAGGSSSRLSGSVSPVKSIASAFEKQSSSSHLDKTAEPPTKKPPMVASSSSVRSLAGALDKVNIVSKLGMSYSKPASSEEAAPATPQHEQVQSTEEARPSATVSSGDVAEESSGLTHATIARPMIPSMKRRRPTVDKGLFSSSPMVGEKKGLEADDAEADEEEEEEEEIEDLSLVDVSAAFIHPQKVAELRVVLKSAHGLFGELEAKKKALQVLIKQKKQVIQRLKESAKSVSAAVIQGNPNSAGDEEEEEVEISTSQPPPQKQNSDQVVIEDEDAFLALQLETEGDFEGAKRHHLLAFERAITQDLTKKSNAQCIGGFASFMIRHELNTLLESDELAQKVSDAFDALESVPSVHDSCMAEKAVFLSRVIHDTDESLDAFRKAYELFPQDAELICNYAQFLNKVVAREAMEEGNEAESRELKSTAAYLYREALTIQPEADVVRCNLGALLVQLSKTGDASEEERNALLLEAKEQLEMATTGSSGSIVMALYNLACVQSSLNLTEECRSTLERVLGMAPQCKGDVAEDPDFENVKGQDWFKQLVA